MKIEVKKFGEILMSRPAGRDAALTIKAYLKPKQKNRIELDFSGVLAVGPSWLDEVLTILRSEYGKARVICLPSKNVSVIESLKILEMQQDKLK
ncbi:MAG TPA: DUF4325 domain-containing protein [Elusimicrobiota bacterium]|nr:DUF4325 domain-containing protein [Elusimicrobiota bacterium]